MTKTKATYPGMGKYDGAQTTETLMPEGKTGRYRRSLSNARECAHHWAANVADEGKAGNVFFSYGVIYSYGNHFPMARHVRLRDGRHVIFLTTRSRSISTSGHQSDTWNAIPDNIPVFRVFDVNADRRYQHRDNFEKLKEEAISLVAQSKKARSRKGQLLAEAGGVIRQANEYAAAVGLRERLSAPEGEDLEGWMSQEIARREAAKKRETAKRKVAVKKAVAEWEEKVRAWWAGGDSYPGTAPGPSELAGTDFLRVKGKLLQTSQRVSVPLRVALPVLQMIREGKTPPENFRIEDFTLREINRDEKYVKVGCHTVSFDEIERLAKTLGL